MKIEYIGYKKVVSEYATQMQKTNPGFTPLLLMVRVNGQKYVKPFWASDEFMEADDFEGMIKAYTISIFKRQIKEGIIKIENSV